MVAVRGPSPGEGGGNVSVHVFFKTKNSGVIEPAKEELVKIRNEKFKDQPLPNAEQARKLIEKVKNGEDAEAVVTEFYLEKNK